MTWTCGNCELEGRKVLREDGEPCKKHGTIGYELPVVLKADSPAYEAWAAACEVASSADDPLEAATAGRAADAIVDEAKADPAYVAALGRVHDKYLEDQRKRDQEREG